MIRPGDIVQVSINESQYRELTVLKVNSKTKELTLETGEVVPEKSIKKTRKFRE